MNILFLCTGNSCRSIMAEAILKHYADDNISVQSAGSNPTGFVHPMALTTLEKNHISSVGFTSKSWDNLNPKPNVVITLCSSAHAETCPTYLGNVVRSHWGMEDPAHAENQEAAFDETFNTLIKRIKKFLSLPFTELKNDDKKLKQYLDNVVSN